MLEERLEEKVCHEQTDLMTEDRTAGELLVPTGAG